MTNDKCDICALKVMFNQDELCKERDIEDFFKTLRELQEKQTISEGHSRRIFASIGTDGSSDKSEMCAVNSVFFLKEHRDKKCPEFILNMNLTVAEALSLHTARSTDNLTKNIHNMT